MSDDKKDDNVVDINEFAAKKYDEMREEDIRKMQEYEQNYIDYLQ